MPPEGARRSGEAFDRRNRQVPVRQDVDVVRRAIAAGFDRAGQSIAPSVKHPAEDAGGCRYGGSPGRFRLLGSRHGPGIRKACAIDASQRLSEFGVSESSKALEDAAEIEIQAAHAASRVREWPFRGQPFSIQSDSPDPVRILSSSWPSPV